jgi:hypothetical protein
MSIGHGAGRRTRARAAPWSKHRHRRRGVPRPIARAGRVDATNDATIATREAHWCIIIVAIPLGAAFTYLSGCAM